LSLLLPPPPRRSPFPYTTLFRSLPNFYIALKKHLYPHHLACGMLDTHQRHYVLSLSSLEDVVLSRLNDIDFHLLILLNGSYTYYFFLFIFLWVMFHLFMFFTFYSNDSIYIHCQVNYYYK